jgi:hypothetical protein
LLNVSHVNAEGLKNYPRQTGPKLTTQNMHDAKGLVKTEASSHVNNDGPDAGPAGSTPQNPGAQNNYQNMLRSPSPNQGLTHQEASQNAAALHNYQNMLRSSSANQGLLQQEASQNAAGLNNYQNMLRSSSANQSILQLEASSIFKGPTGVHSGIQLEAARSFRAAQLGPMSFQQAVPLYQQNSFGAGVSPQYQQHVMQQLLQEANRSTNNRVLAQQQPLSSPSANGGLAITNSGASGDQAQHMNNNGAAKGVAAPMGTVGTSNLINSGAAGVVQRCSSFKSVTSNPAAAVAGNPPTPKAESMHEMDELDHLITSELAESGLFMGEQQGGGGGYSWHM